MATLFLCKRPHRHRFENTKKSYRFSDGIKTNIFRCVSLVASLHDSQEWRSCGVRRYFQGRSLLFGIKHSAGTSIWSTWLSWESWYCIHEETQWAWLLTTGAAVVGPSEVGLSSDLISGQHFKNSAVWTTKYILRIMPAGIKIGQLATWLLWQSWVLLTK